MFVQMDGQDPLLVQKKAGTVWSDATRRFVMLASFALYECVLYAVCRRSSAG